MFPPTIRNFRKNKEKVEHLGKQKLSETTQRRTTEGAHLNLAAHRWTDFIKTPTNLTADRNCCAAWKRKKMGL
jgi:hypothetical protein